MPRSAPALDKGVDRRDVGGKQHRAIEQDRHHRRCPRGPRRQLPEADDAASWLVEARLSARDRGSEHEPPAPACPPAAAPAPHILPGRPRGNRPSSAASSAAAASKLRPAGRRAAFAGQQRQLDATLARQPRPAGRSHSATSRSRRACAPGSPWRGARRCRSTVDGHRMAQIAQLREPHARAGAASACQAAASPARSLSVKDSATISAGVWPRSTGSARSSSEAEWWRGAGASVSRRVYARSPARSSPLRPITTSRAAALARRSRRGRSSG